MPELFCNCNDCGCATTDDCTDSECGCCGSETADPFHDIGLSFARDVTGNLARAGTVATIAPHKEKL